MTGRFILLLSCFFLSGCAGLIYQTAWLLEFSLIFGSSEVALITVLAAYMAGLASGAALMGHFMHRIQRFMGVYALLELGIALAAVLVPLAIKLAAYCHGAWFSGGLLSPHGESWLSALFYFSSSFIILWLPTAFMGATLPLLARWAIVKDSEIGSKMGQLYTVNTAGAALGTLSAAFLWLPQFGLGVTVGIAVAMNFVVFGLAGLLSRNASKNELPTVMAFKPKPPSTAKFHWILPVIFFSGVVSFTWEVLWTRLLSHLLGSSVYSFAMMLATFLTGIALGSGIASKGAKTTEHAARNFVLAQIGIGFFGLIAFLGVDKLAPFATAANHQHVLLRGALLIAPLLLPSAIAIGATFPLAVRLLAQKAEQAGHASARIFAWNTLGAILGVTVAGYWILPIFKFAGTALLATTCSLILALTAGLLLKPIKPLFVAVAPMGLVLIFLFPPPTPWQVLRHSPLTGQTVPPSKNVAYYGVGRSATVLLTEEANFWRLTTDGLPESAIERPWGRPNRFVVARWLSLLPLAARPEAESMLVVGFGAGITIEKIPPSVKDIHVVELEHEVIRANRAITNRPQQPLDDPRVQVHIQDARGALRLAKQRFDAIVSQPSHPWTSGAANLFTREFFSSVRDHLTADGVFVQWMGLAFIDGPLLKSLVATATDVFNHVEVYRPGPGVVLILSSQAPLHISQTMPQSLSMAKPFWKALGIFTVQDLLAARALSSEGSTEFSHGAAVSTDRRNLFRYGSPRALQNPLLAHGGQQLLAPFDPLLTSDPESLYLVRRLIFQGELARAKSVGKAISNNIMQLNASALCSLASGRPKEAEALLRAALKESPRNQEARAALMQQQKPRIVRGEPIPGLLLPLSPIEQAIVDSWRLLPFQDWQGIRHKEALLASIDTQHPWWLEATRLRVAWRNTSGQAAYGEEALALVYPLLAPIAHPRDLLLRAHASVICGKPKVALSSIQETLDLPTPKHLKQAIFHQASALLEMIPDNPETNSWRLQLTKQCKPQ